MKRHRVGTGIFLGILCLALFLGKVAFNSYEEYRQGEEAVRQGDFKKAILHYDRSIHWYTPWSSSVKDSILRLWEVGTKLEEKGEKDAALEAYWALRSSLYGVRSFYTPHAEWIEKANDRIAGIWTEREAHSADEKGMTLTERKGRYLKSLQKDWAPKVNWAAAILFYLLFIVGLLVFVIKPALAGGKPIQALFLGALLGLISYATYDLSNLATLKDWPIVVTVVDLVWGSVLGGSVSLIAALIGRRFLKL